ncbi:MAG: glycosyltransferase [Hyphomicrobiaceae bacterium]|nr:glycosyltransferase [Hyphomicrobiaceae bacterium]
MQLPDPSRAKPLSIGVVLGSISRSAGGISSAARRPAQHLTAAGHEVTVIALRDNFSERDLHEWTPIEPILVDALGPNRIGLSPQLYRELSRRHFDIVHQHGIWQAFSGFVARLAKRGTPTLIAPHGMLDPWALRQNVWKKRLASNLYEDANMRRASCFHALSHSECGAIRAYGLTNPVAVIRNGIDLPNGNSASPPEWWPDKRVLLFVGRIHEKKGVVGLVEAFATLRANAPEVAKEWNLVIAGWDDGGHLAELTAAISRNGLEEYVVLPGPLYGSQKEAALAAAEAFVLPSYSEGLPMSVLEAWAWSLPVLMTEACNLVDGFVAGAAIRIESDPASLADKLCETLIRSPTELAAIGARGHEHVATHYAWPGIASSQESLYRWMVAGCPSDSRPNCVV